MKTKIDSKNGVMTAIFKMLADFTKKQETWIPNNRKSRYPTWKYKAPKKLKPFEKYTDENHYFEGLPKTKLTEEQRKQKNKSKSLRRKYA